LEQIALTNAAAMRVVDERRRLSAAVTARRPGGVWFKGNKQAVGIEQFISIQLEAFPEEGKQTSIHGDGSGWVWAMFWRTQP
jgi:hypothetical protein